MTFHNHSKQIVEDFLGTVAYVDDLIFSTKKEVQPGIIPFTGTMREAVVSSEITEKIEQNIPKQLVPNIDPLVFTNAFIEKGIHCALLELSDDKSNIESIKKTLKKSDVIILDWQMHNDLGKCSAELIKFMLTEDKVTSLSLRLLVIYTDQPNYNTLITENLISIFDELQIKYTLNSDVEIQSGHTKIVVLQKPKINTKEDGKVSGEELPERIIEEMTMLTEGLVSNTALKAVSVIRRNTHNLLGIFNKGLDSAYLAHRSLLPTPDDAEPLMISSIVDSMNSILTYSNCISNCNYEQIEKWFDSNSYADKEIVIVKKTNKVNVNDEERKAWLKKGSEEFTKYILAKNGKQPLTDSNYENYEKHDLLKNSTDCFITENSNCSEEFAIITHHKSNLMSQAYIPYLTLGAVLQDIADGKYYLCIQQRCDSVRIKETEIRNFLFLPIEEKGSFPIIIINSEGVYLTLKVNATNCHSLLIKQFSQTKNGIIEAINETGNFYFNDTNDTKYKWILDLKESHAQRIANKFAAQLSRVGLDESEWLRRN
jgi:hypothetical protein